MARYYLTIPSTSCDCERAFSRVRRTITSDCNALSCNTIEVLQLQKDWLNRGVVQSELIYSTSSPIRIPLYRRIVGRTINRVAGLASELRTSTS